MFEQQLHKLQQNKLISELIQIRLEDSRWDKLSIFKAKRIDNYKIWGMAFFVECNQDFLCSESQFGLEECEEFQSKLLGKAFFSENTSLRWNYYLYFVYTDKEVLKDIDKSPIEADTHYARKRIVCMDALDALLKLVNYDSQENEMPDPEGEWLNILAPQQLLGCLYNDQYTASIKSYLEYGTSIGNLNDFTKSSVPAQSRANLIPVSIKELYTCDYRKEAFGDRINLPFKTFNLIEGENGTGKSSIIDAIELALTGSIKRLADTNGTFDGEITWVNTINQVHNDIVFNSNGSPDIKDREQAWYNTPRTRLRSTISDKFGQINRFSIESVFSLVNSQCRDKDSAIQNSITTLCFGDSLALMQKNWLEYKKRFETEKNRCSNAIDKLKEEQVANQNRLEALRDEVQSRQVDIRQLYYDLFGEKPKDGDCIKRLEDIYLRFVNEIMVLSAIKEPISYTQLQNLDIQRKETVAELIIRRDDYMNLKASCKQKHMAYESKEIEKNKLAGQISTYSKYLYDANYLSQQLNINNISENQLDSFITDYRKLKNTINSLKYDHKLLWTSFPYRQILSVSQIDTQMQDLQKRILVCKNEIIDLINQELALEARKNNAEQNMNRIYMLQTELLQYGQTIVSETNRPDCPLCGQLYSNTVVLQNKIQELAQRCSTPSQDLLTSLLADLSSVQLKLSTHKKEVQIQENEEKFLEKLSEVLKLCTSIKNMHKCKQVRDILTLLEETEAENTQRLHILNGLQSGIAELRNNFSNIGIPISLLRDYFEVSEKALSVLPQQVKALIATQNIIHAEILEFDALILKNANLEQSLQKAMQDSQQVVSVLSAVAVLHSVNVAIFPDTDMLVLKNNLLKLEGTTKVITENSEISVIAQKLKQLKDVAANQNTYIKRCNAAIDVLDKLKTLSEYSQKFLDDNLLQIATLFKKLHLPPEFTDLIRLDNEIVISRPNSNTYVRINQMSMGQRTSLTLAILFQMHIMGKNTPRILLLDEPISNLDDVHIMNMVDMLRELVLNGAQLFITTSSNEIARYLERKFSFLQDDMICYQLKREVVGEAIGKTVITSKPIPFLIASGK